MPLEHLLLIPRTYLIASRLHRKAGRPVYAGRICLGLAGLVVVGFFLAGLIDMAGCDDPCDHPS